MVHGQAGRREQGPSRSWSKACAGRGPGRRHRRPVPTSAVAADCFTWPAGVSSRRAGSSVCRWKIWTPTAFAPSRAKRLTSSRRGRSTRATGRRLRDPWITYPVRRSGTAEGGRAGSRTGPYPGEPSPALPERAASAALPVVRLLGKSGLAERCRIIMEKPFGTDLASAVTLNDALHETFDESQIFRIDHFLGKEAALEHPRVPVRQRAVRADLEPPAHRARADRRARDAVDRAAHRFYEKTGAYRDMVVNHLFQVLAFMAMEPPTALEPALDRRGEEQGVPLDEPDRAVAGRARAVRRLPRRAGRAPHSETETFIALRCEIDNWRWAGVPFYLRTGKRMAEGARIISIAFREPPKSMFPPARASARTGPTTSRSTSPTRRGCRCRSTASVPARA